MSVRFGGTGQYVRYTTNLPTSSAFTIAGWCDYVASRSAFAYFVELASGTVSAASYLALGWDNTNKFGTSSSGSGGVGSFFATNPPVGSKLFWALVGTGTGASGITAYYRLLQQNALSSVTDTGASFTTASLTLGNDSYDEWTNTRLWNVMCWNRALTSRDLLVQSYFGSPVDPTSLNFWLPMDRADLIKDMGQNRRDPIIGGTLKTEQELLDVLP